MQKILGLDIGSYSVKALILLNDYKNYTIHKFFEVRLEPAENKSEYDCQGEALKSLLQLCGRDFDVVYTALDSKLVSLRRVDFDNIRKKDIPYFLKNELEGSTPFDLDESIIDSQMIRFSKQHSSVLAVLAQKEKVKQILELLETNELKAKVIDVDCLTYLNLSSFMFQQHEVTIEEQFSNSCKVIIDIGHNKTTVTFIKNKRILFARIINIAGLYFTERIKDEFKLSLEEAETLKCYIGEVVVGRQKPQSEHTLVVSFLTSLVGELSEEILRTIKSFQSKDSILIDEIFITGGSSKIKHIDKYFEDSFSIPVTFVSINSKNIIFDLSDDSHISQQNDSEPNVEFCSVYQALAIAIRGLYLKDSLSQINLRKGDLVQIGDHDKILSQIYILSVTSAIIILCLTASYFFRSWYYNKEITLLKNQFRNDVISMYGTEPINLKQISKNKNWDFQTYSNLAIPSLKQSLMDKKSLLSTYSESGSSMILRVLNQISQIIPKDIYFEVSDFKFSNNTIYIEADTDNSANIDKIIELLKSANLLSEVTKKSAAVKAGTDGKLTRFSLSAKVISGEG